MVRGVDTTVVDDAEDGCSETLVSRRRHKWMKLAPVASAGVVDDTEGSSDRQEQLGTHMETPDQKRSCCLGRGRPLLARALFLSFKRPLLAAAFFKLCQDTLTFVSPWILR